MEVQDIEQIVNLGKDLDTCPYYGTRHTIPQAQVGILLCFIVKVFFY